MTRSSGSVLLLSGGMDSATCLWWMRQHLDGPIHALSIDYGQRHRVELACAAHLAERAGVPHKVVGLDLAAIGGSPLTDAALEVPAAGEDRQLATVVPFRNLLFAALAAAWAETLGLAQVYLAPVKDDYRSYRDCRRPFYDSLEQTLGLGATREGRLVVHTPFVHKWKNEVVQLGLEMGVPYELTHICYVGLWQACGK